MIQLPAPRNGKLTPEVMEPTIIPGNGSIQILIFEHPPILSIPRMINKVFLSLLHPHMMRRILPAHSLVNLDQFRFLKVIQLDLSIVFNERVRFRVEGFARSHIGMTGNPMFGRIPFYPDPRLAFQPYHGFLVESVFGATAIVIQLRLVQVGVTRAYQCRPIEHAIDTLLFPPRKVFGWDEFGDVIAVGSEHVASVRKKGEESESRGACIAPFIFIFIVIFIVIFSSISIR